jgi:hypothetical protein
LRRVSGSPQRTRLNSPSRGDNEWQSVSMQLPHDHAMGQCFMRCKKRCIVARIDAPLPFKAVSRAVSCAETMESRRHHSWPAKLINPFGAEQVRRHHHIISQVESSLHKQTLYLVTTHSTARNTCSGANRFCSEKRLPCQSEMRI